MDLLTQQFVEQHLSDDVHVLALKTAPQGKNKKMFQLGL